jgi:hypothetical protein
MAIERRNPLPTGQYWVDVFELGKDSSPFEDWLSKHADSIHVDKREAFLSEGRVWYMFTVLSPTDWEGPGYPTISKGETSPEETAQEPPPPPTVGEQLESAGEGLKTGLTVAGIALGGLLLWKLLS